MNFKEKIQISAKKSRKKKSAAVPINKRTIEGKQRKQEEAMESLQSANKAKNRSKSKSKSKSNAAVEEAKSKVASTSVTVSLRSNVTKEDSLRAKLHFFFFHVILLVVYSIYSVFRSAQYFNNKIRIKFLNLAYNPSKTPEIIRDDVNKLSKVPKRVGAIVNLKSEQEEGGGYYGLLNDTAELTTWTLAAGIPYLSIYEINGALKSNVEDLRIAIYNKLTDYFGPNSVPKFIIKVPHLNLTYYGLNNDADEKYKNSTEPSIEISLLSYEDGKPTIVELTKTMAELAKKKEISLKDVTIDLIDNELTELIGVEPDLILLFTPTLDLQGYPPWHIRLSELYWEPDNEDVSYAIFLRGLQKYSTCKINVGK